MALLLLATREDSPKNSKTLPPNDNSRLTNPGAAVQDTSNPQDALISQLSDPDAALERARSRIEECAKRVMAAPREDKEAVSEQCQKELEKDHPAPTPYADGRSIEMIDWSQALDWWPYEPLFRSPTNGPTPGAIEVLFASSSAGGRKGDPQTQQSAIDVLYQYAPHTAEKDTYFQIIDGGGLFITVRFFPTGDTIPFSEESKTKSKPVFVRQRPARLIEFVRDGETRRDLGRYRANVDLRAIRWELAVSAGTLQWAIANHPKLYTEEQTLRFIEALVEIY